MNWWKWKKHWALFKFAGWMGPFRVLCSSSLLYSYLFIFIFIIKSGLLSTNSMAGSRLGAGAPTLSKMDPTLLSCHFPPDSSSLLLHHLPDIFKDFIQQFISRLNTTLHLFHGFAGENLQSGNVRFSLALNLQPEWKAGQGPRMGPSVTTRTIPNKGERSHLHSPFNQTSSTD